MSSRTATAFSAWNSEAASACRTLSGEAMPMNGTPAALAERGTPRATFNRAWRETWDKLSALNRILLAPPP